MKLLLFEHPQIVTERECARDLALLPSWRREKALSYRLLIDRVLCAKAYLLLRQGLSELYGITEAVDFDYVGSRKPVLRRYPDIHFNLSHCRQGVLCVLHDRPVGCDIEERRKKLPPALCRYSCSDGERRRILAAPDPCLEFCRLWTRKEAFLKMQGRGIGEALPDLFSGERPPGLRLCSVIRTGSDVVYSVCTTAPGDGDL